MWIIWLAILIFALIAELATVNMVSLWFVFGAIGALIADLNALSLVWQLIIFFAVSMIGLLLFIFIFKPRMDNKRSRKEVPTNADRIIGHEGIVTVDIRPLHHVGQISVLGQSWSAISEDENIEIPAGTKVKVVRLESVKAVVRPCDPQEIKE